MTRKYIIGYQVESIDELDGSGAKIRKFIDEIGDGDVEVQVAINPLLSEQVPPANAIGFAVESDEEEEYYVEEDDEE